ncbi:hypothetical protein PR003_g25283 [Phytophthora rubi]|uniref:Uncharacterized protein n=1 Tax=Phytophthora rubi TaxID=129364 RepID=A0A6A4CQB7_9STRA|nr:hypothetical protein PR003_g25283 [Phytophthora rubi]
MVWARLQLRALPQVKFGIVGDSCTVLNTLSGAALCPIARASPSRLNKVQSSSRLRLRFPPSNAALVAFIHHGMVSSG